MTPKVSIIMGSTSDLPVMEKAAEVLNNFCIPFEMPFLHTELLLRWRILQKMRQKEE